MPELGSRTRVGTVLTLPGATTAELLAEPFDLVWVDLEHAALGPLDAQEMIIGAQAAGSEAFVRLPAEPGHPLAAMLDAGADGVVLADVRAAATAATAVERILHPPAGTRGWGPRRLSLRRRPNAQELPSPAIHVQIESREGVEECAEIGAVAGLDALIVGTADLSFSLGKPLEMDTPELIEAIETVRGAAVAAGVGFGLAGPIDSLPGIALRGAELLVHSTDARICASAVDGAAERMRNLIGDGNGPGATDSEEEDS